LDQVGGKGLSLSRMWASGLPVPDGFHVTTQAYRDFTATHDLDTEIVGALAAVTPGDTALLEAAAQRIADRFASASMPPDIAAALTLATRSLGAEPVAVRSSSTAEDLPGLSGAGQHDTFLNILRTDAILLAIQRCWASLWTARAIAYRLRQGIDSRFLAQAVVVQRLVVADAAGVLFTANPLNGRRDQIVINAVRGLGEAIVSGQVTPETVVVVKDTGRVVSRTRPAQAVMTQRTFQGTSEVAVPQPLRTKAVLSRRQIGELGRWARIVERTFGQPMDVEWAVTADEVQLVQARPITVLPPEWRPDHDHAVAQRASLAEHLPSPVSPLFATLGLPIVNAFTRTTWEEFMGAGASKLLFDEGAYQVINGYVYLVTRDRLLTSVRSLSPRQLRRTVTRSVERWSRDRDDFLAVVTRSADEPLAPYTASDLVVRAHRLFEESCRYHARTQFSLPAAVLSEGLLSLLFGRVIRRVSGHEVGALLQGFETDCRRSERSLSALASWVADQSELCAFIRRTPVADLARAWAGATVPAGVPQGPWSDWRTRVEHHLNHFGRTIFDFDFAQPTALETPILVFEAVKAFLGSSVVTPNARQAAAVARREAIRSAVLARLHGPGRRLFTALLRWAQETAPMREDSINHLGLAHPELRRTLHDLGRRFAERGIIDSAADVFWLEADEVAAAAQWVTANGQPPSTTVELVGEPTSAGPTHGPAVARRRAAHADRPRYAPPGVASHRDLLATATGTRRARRHPAKLVLRGIGTSGGVVTGPARVLRWVEDFARFEPGEILVAVTTTPAWTPLFSTAAAVVTDIGGPLSHSSVIAREYGLPAVMATMTGTDAIESGQTITVDGTAGTVILHTRR
jgi:pyruvate,water dikinase